MKNQYFGDARDYLKYSLLRTLGRELSVAVCWLLTEDDLGTDGRKTGYLERPDLWREFDPPIFDFLAQAIAGEQRNVDVMEQATLLGDNCCFFSEIVPADGLERCRYFDRFVEHAKGADLVFFDPDNGIEPRSAKGPKYVHWHELDRAWLQGHSLLVYQHFGRRSRNAFMEEKAVQLRQLRGANAVYVFHDDSVAFFLVSQPRHQERIRRAKTEIEDKWVGRMRVLEFSQPSR